MIPMLVKREQLMSANSLFLLALQAAFVVGFAVLGPLAYTVFGTQLLILIVAAAYGVAGLLCWLPPVPASSVGQASLASARSAIRATAEQLREGIYYIRDHHNIFWSLTYLTMAFMFAPVLVLDRGHAFWPAMRLSMRVVNGRLLPMIGLVLLAWLVSLGGLLVLCLGIFVAIPIIMASYAYAYEDLFGEAGSA